MVGMPGTYSWLMTCLAKQYAQGLLLHESRAMCSARSCSSIDSAHAATKPSVQHRHTTCHGSGWSTREVDHATKQHGEHHDALLGAPVPVVCVAWPSICSLPELQSGFQHCKQLLQWPGLLQLWQLPSGMPAPWARHQGKGRSCCMEHAALFMSNGSWVMLVVYAHLRRLLLP